MSGNQTPSDKKESKRITNYYVVSDQEISGLETQVQKLLFQGWQPLGGIAVKGWGSAAFIQAMVIYG